MELLAVLVAVVPASSSDCCKPARKLGCDALAALLVLAPPLSISPPLYRFHSASTDAGGSDELLAPVRPLKKSMADRAQIE
jgi:hypothetical protein